MNTNTPTELTLQQIAAQHGYNVSGQEIALLMTVAGAVVHFLHQLVAAWGTIGGWAGVKSYFLKGKNSTDGQKNNN